MKKAKWLENSIAKPDGYYSKTGEKLKGQRLSEVEISEWNDDEFVLAAVAPKIAPIIKKAEEANPSQKEGLFQRIKSKLLGTH